MNPAERKADRSAWLGGEAHVRYQDGRSMWQRLTPTRTVVLITLAFIAGAALGGAGGAWAGCRKRRVDSEASSS